MTTSIETLMKELATELQNILKYWRENAVDEVNGGFVGQRDYWNREISGANKGIILNTRILWTFSAAGNHLKDPGLRTLADRAYDYLQNKFQDKKYGGVYWEVDSFGNPVKERKQIYAQAFAIYALSEYYLYSGRKDAQEWALSLFELIEEHARDTENEGYFEAFQKDWSPVKDMRLSEKDRNSSKTMNTHLHVLEAYATLYKVTGNARVKSALANLVKLFLVKFYDPSIQHFQLFFDDHWRREGNIISYGHDIEAVWLMIEAAKEIQDKDLLEQTKKLSVEVAETFLKEAWTPGAGVMNEKDLDTGEVDTDRHWWPQAEAMVGLDYAYENSGDEKFCEALLDIWEYTKIHILDRESGEWFFRVDENNKPYKEEDKLGMWKCPYHNSRTCMVLLKRNL